MRETRDRRRSGQRPGARQATEGRILRGLLGRHHDSGLRRGFSGGNLEAGAGPTPGTPGAEACLQFSCAGLRCRRYRASATTIQTGFSPLAQFQPRPDLGGTCADLLRRRGRSYRHGWRSPSHGSGYGRSIPRDHIQTGRSILCAATVHPTGRSGDSACQRRSPCRRDYGGHRGSSSGICLAGCWGCPFPRNRSNSDAVIDGLRTGRSGARNNQERPRQSAGTSVQYRQRSGFFHQARTRR